MNKQELLESTLANLKNLPRQQLQEVSNFAEFLLNKVNNTILSDETTELNIVSESFDFLETEPDLYQLSDLKEVYAK